MHILMYMLLAAGLDTNVFLSVLLGFWGSLLQSMYAIHSQLGLRT